MQFVCKNGPCKRDVDDARVASTQPHTRCHVPTHLHLAEACSQPCSTFTERPTDDSADDEASHAVMSPSSHNEEAVGEQFRDSDVTDAANDFTL